MSRLMFPRLNRSVLGVSNGGKLWSPISLSPMLWLKASEINGVSDGTTLSQWNDLSGNNNHCTQPTTGSMPYYNARVSGGPEVSFTYRNMAGTTRRYLSIPNGVSINRNNCSIFAVGRPQTRALTAGSMGVYEGGNAGTLNFGWGPNCVTAYNGALITTTKTVGYQPHAIGLTSNASAFKLWVDGVSQSYTAATSATATGGGISSVAGSLYLYGALKELLIWNRCLTDSEYALLQAYAERLYYKAENTKILVCDGDSLTTGYGALNNANYPTQLWSMLGREWKLYNAAVAGQQTSTMISDAATEIDPLYSASYQKNVVVSWSGVLDIYNGVTPADTWSRINDYCTTRKTAGWDVVVCTILPSGFITEQNRTDINDLIRANWNGCADALADLAGDSRIGDPGDNSDSTYYNNDDGNATHMKQAGYYVVASIIKSAIDTL